MFNPGGIDHYIREHTQAAEHEAINWRLAQAASAHHEVRSSHKLAQCVVGLGNRVVLLIRLAQKLRSPKPIIADRVIQPKIQDVLVQYLWDKTRSR